MSLLDFLSEEEKKSLEIVVPTKVCIKCKRELPETAFTRASGRPYTRTECRECNNKASKHVKSLKKKHKEPPPDYICPLCLKTEEQCRGIGGKKVGTWCIDHNHKTGKFRGWLCHRCNRTLGGFEDDIERLKRATAWVENDGFGIPDG